MGTGTVTGEVDAVATYVLIHGAGGDSWYSHLVAPRLYVAPPHRHRGRPSLRRRPRRARRVRRRRGRCRGRGTRGRRGGAVARGIHGAAGVRQAGRVLAGPGGGDGAPPGRVPRRLVGEHGPRLPRPLRPRPEVFADDLPADLAAELPTYLRPQSGTPFEQPWPLGSWPDVPTRFLLCRYDCFFPAPLPAQGGAGATGHHARRDGRRTPAGAGPARPAGGLAGALPGRVGRGPFASGSSPPATDARRGVVRCGPSGRGGGVRHLPGRRSRGGRAFAAPFARRGGRGDRQDPPGHPGAQQRPPPPGHARAGAVHTGSPERWTARGRDGSRTASRSTPRWGRPSIHPHCAKSVWPRRWRSSVHPGTVAR